MCSQNDDPTGWAEAEQRPASRIERIDDLAERLANYNEARAREQLRERIRIVGWIFVLMFVGLFLIVIWNASPNA
jgi:hypothetical protein